MSSKVMCHLLLTNSNSFMSLGTFMAIEIRWLLREIKNNTQYELPSVAHFCWMDVIVILGVGSFIVRLKLPSNHANLTSSES